MFKNGPIKKLLFFFFWSVHFLRSILLFKKIFTWEKTYFKKRILKTYFTWKKKDEFNMKESENSFYLRL